MGTSLFSIGARDRDRQEPAKQQPCDAASCYQGKREQSKQTAPRSRQYLTHPAERKRKEERREQTPRTLMIEHACRNKVLRRTATARPLSSTALVERRQVRRSNRNVARVETTRALMPMHGTACAVACALSASKVKIPMMLYMGKASAPPVAILAGAVLAFAASHFISKGLEEMDDPTHSSSGSTA